MAFSDSGKQRRLARLFERRDGRTVILAIDDGLIAGPSPWLSDLSRFFSNIASSPPDGVLLFTGVLSRHCSTLAASAAIVNLTASTTRSQHTRKVLCTEMETAVAAGADLVAVHVNVTSRYEGEMFRTLSMTVREAEAFGVPVFAIMYPRREGNGHDDDYQELKKGDPENYSRLIAHAARIGMELGADVIKTQYTGSPETFERVVEATRPVPVVISGGPLCSESEALAAAEGAIGVGARGVSFGRNVFQRDNPSDMLRLLHSAIHDGVAAHSC